MSEQNSNPKSMSPPEERKNKEQADRLRQASVEYWKLEYDVYKHMMTFSLAAIAAFGAMLGGVFSDPSVWEPDWPLAFLNLSRNFTIILTFAGFIVAAITCVLGMTHAANCIYEVGGLETVTDINTFHHTQRKVLSRRVVLGDITILFLAWG